ncbi:MAG: Rqc2 family fibronectin-binding protein [Bacillota bacterium]
MDGITLYAIRSEISGYLPLKVQKIRQPAQKELVFSVWSASLRDRLVISLEGNRPFLGFSDERKENPSTPPGFCLGLRKRLEGGRLTGIRQHRMDRVLYLDFEGHDDFGNPAPFVLVFDLAGRGKNIGLYRDGLLEAAAVPPSGDRFLHGRPYNPPEGDRLDLSVPVEAGTLEKLLAGARARQADVPVTALRLLNSSVEGIGKDLAVSILLSSGVDPDRPLDGGAESRLAQAITEVSARLVAQRFYPAIYRGAKGEPLFHVLPLSQYDSPDTFGSVMEGLRELRRRETAGANESLFRSYVEGLHRKVSKKVESRYHAQSQDYARSQDYEKYKTWAQLLDTSGVRTLPGLKEVTCLDYYQDPPTEVAVPLDPRYSARDNARNYWNRYAKLNRARKVLEESLAKTEGELERISQARDVLESADRGSGDTLANLARAASLLESIARRNGVTFSKPRGLEALAVARAAPSPYPGQHRGSRRVSPGSTRQSQSGAQISPSGSPRIETVEGSRGILYFVGGNARQNDYLLTKVRKPGDIWFHAKNAKGAHVLLRPGPDAEPAEEDILVGARLAAERSEARASAKVDVDVVDAARVRKPRGAAPGFVTYTGQKTVVVSLR